jgi:hypothetical protein
MSRQLQWRPRRHVRTAAAFAASALAGLILTGCGSSDGPSSAPPQNAPSSSPHPGSSSGSSSDPSTTTRPRGSGFAEFQEYHRLNVRVLGYQRSALPKPNSKTRLDVINVEECAPDKHSLVVPHNHWMLVDADDVILGRAGAKLVHGKAIEDTPVTLAAGACRRSALVIATPYYSIPIVVRDGTVATWTIPH